MIGNGDLYFIKTQNAESKTIEVHRMPGPDFDKFDIQTATAFGIVEGAEGVWTVDNGDLYFIETGRNVPGIVQVHSAPHQHNFQHIKHYISKLAFLEPGDRTYTIRGGDLYLILDDFTQSDYVEVYCAKGTTGYESVASFVTGFKVNEVAGYGSWHIGQNGDLYLIKMYATASGMVEIHIATFKSRYQEIKSYSTAFKADNKTGGYYKNASIPENTVGIWMI